MLRSPLFVAINRAFNPLYSSIRFHDPAVKLALLLDFTDDLRSPSEKNIVNDDLMLLIFSTRLSAR